MRARQRLIAAALAAVSVVAVTATAVAVWSLTRSALSLPTTMRFTLDSPTEAHLGQFFALSPDGRNLAFFANGFTQQLWIHSLERGDASASPGRQCQRRPVLVGGQPLHRVWRRRQAQENRPVGRTGGSDLRRAEFCRRFVEQGRRHRLRDRQPGSDAGGGGRRHADSADHGRSDRGETVHTGPWFLPDGRRFLYLRSSKNPENAGVYVGALDAKPEDQSLTRLLPAQQNPQYIHAAGSGTGYLVFMRDGALMAQPFDPGRIALGGEPVRVADQVGTAAGGLGSYGFFWVSNANALVYRRNQSATASIVWTSRTGQETAALATNVDRPLYPKLSPDGRRLAVIVAGDLWVYDLEGRPPIRLTFGGTHYSPLWTPDGRRIAHETGSVVMAVTADGSAASPELMSPAEGHFHPHGWSRDGREILLVAMQGATTHSPDIVRYSWREKGDFRTSWRRPRARGPTARPCRRTASGWRMRPTRQDVLRFGYAVNLHAGAAVRLSANGGVEPVWAKNGRELYYLEQNKMMSVAVSAGAPFNFKPATLLFESRYQHAGQPPTYDVAADGRFLMIKPANPQLSSFNVLLNWSPAVPAASH